MNFEQIDEQNVLVNKDGDNSLVNHLKDITHYPSGFFSIIIISGKAYSVSNTKGVVWIDTHSNGSYGGKLSIIDTSKLHLSDLEFADVELGYMCIVKTNMYDDDN